MTATGAARPFGSVLVAMITPFDDAGQVDPAAAATLAAGLVEQGCDGLVISGTTGEAPTLTDDEKSALLRAVVEAVGDRAAVLAGVGTYDTRHSCDLAGQAAKAGATGLLAVTPYYSKPSQEGLLAHFTALAEATDLPVMLYDIPGRCGTAIATETLVRLGEHRGITAVKDAKGDLYEGSWVMARSDLAFYSGADELNLAWLTHGGVGVVSVVGHVAAPRYVSMVAAVEAGDLRTALGLHRGLLPAVQGLMTRAQGAVMAKAALHLQGVLASRGTRLPLLPATDEQVAVLRTDLQAAGLL